MILTGNEIQLAYERAEIILQPFKKRQLNPNSYNFRLYPQILEQSITRDGARHYEQICLNEKGFILQPNILYLGATFELVGSTKYAMTLLGRSSVGRLGLFLNSTADLGHVGSISRWTLELSVVQPLRIFPYMFVGQVAFWSQLGPSTQYDGRYYGDIEPIPSRDNFTINK
jgi:dCTP deaminase